MRSSEELVSGSLLGLACGDALGSPFEGCQRVPKSSLSQHATDGGPLKYTDDTAMTVVLVEHLCRTRGRLVDAELVLEWAQAWRRDPDRGYGSGPPMIFRSALAGGDWRGLARGLFAGSGSLGNGAAMRTAPIAFLPEAVPVRVRLARQQAMLTHTHPLAQDGAALLCAAVAISAATSGEPLDAESFLAQVKPHVETPQFREALQCVHIAARRGWGPSEVAAELGNDISALGSAPSALAVFLLNPDDVHDALLFAVELGGDTDTVAAMAGAIVGARCGRGGIPDSWLRRLEDADRMSKLATALAALGD